MFVSLISVSLHAYPAYLGSVRTPYWISVVTALHVDYCGLGCLYIIYVYLGVGRECVLLAGKLAARICYVPAVRTPCELLESSERLSREFVKLSFPFEDVLAFLDLLPVKTEICHECVRDLHYCMVPMPVHQVVGLVCGSLVKIRIAVCR